MDRCIDEGVRTNTEAPHRETVFTGMLPLSVVFSAGVLLVPVTLELYTEWTVAISKQSTSQLTLRRTYPRKLNMHPVPPLPNSFVFVSFCLEL